MVQLYLRYYPPQTNTQFVGDLIVGIVQDDIAQVDQMLRTLEEHKKIVFEIAPADNKSSWFSTTSTAVHESFSVLELVFKSGSDRIKLERKKQVLSIHLNHYTLQDLYERLRKVISAESDYGLDMYELVSNDGTVSRSNRRFWVVGA